ncbi:uncharacterized protein LOC106734271 [Tupaia chinensis]|uniref:uncharacterized protein LOC106734271 n=1 Tax=Tupaia chinensis TaxID=246437 RepID=UPI0007040185|nr:uncharacterized protein LOC106734271 [Tupaia chinensis]
MGFAGVGVGLLSIRYGAGVGERQGYVYTVESKSPPLRVSGVYTIRDGVRPCSTLPRGVQSGASPRVERSLPLFRALLPWKGARNLPLYARLASISDSPPIDILITRPAGSRVRHKKKAKSLTYTSGGGLRRKDSTTLPRLRRRTRAAGLGFPDPSPFGLSLKGRSFRLTAGARLSSPQDHAGPASWLLRKSMAGPTLTRNRRRSRSLNNWKPLRFPRYQSSSICRGNKHISGMEQINVSSKTITRSS